MLDENTLNIINEKQNTFIKEIEERNQILAEISFIIYKQNQHYTTGEGLVYYSTAYEKEGILCGYINNPEYKNIIYYFKGITKTKLIKKNTETKKPNYLTIKKEDLLEIATINNNEIKKYNNNKVTIKHINFKIRKIFKNDETIIPKYLDNKQIEILKHICLTGKRKFIEEQEKTYNENKYYEDLEEIEQIYKDSWDFEDETYDWRKEEDEIDEMDYNEDEWN